MKSISDDKTPFVFSVYSSTPLECRIRKPQQLSPNIPEEDHTTYQKMYNSWEGNLCVHLSTLTNPTTMESGHHCLPSPLYSVARLCSLPEEEDIDTGHHIVMVPPFLSPSIKGPTSYVGELREIASIVRRNDKLYLQKEKNKRIWTYRQQLLGQEQFWIR